MFAAGKSFKLVWRCHQLLFGFLDRGHLPRVSRLTVNDKRDNNMIPEAAHRYPGNYLTAEEKAGKSQLGHRLMKTVRAVIVSNGIPYHPVKSVGLKYKPPLVKKIMFKV